MPIVPRKRCPKCFAVFEGPGVKDVHSCDQCGNGYLTNMPPVNLEPENRSGAPLPRSGGDSAITHTRDGF